MAHQYGPGGHPQYIPPPGPAYGPGPSHPPGRPAPRNGFGLASAIVGGIGILFGLVPLTFWIAGPLALTSLGLGLAALGRVRRGTAGNTGTSVTGLVLGGIAAALSIWGAVVFFSALNEFGDELQKIGDDTTRSIECLDKADTPEEISACGQ
jgi:hypothetical protein